MLSKGWAWKKILVQTKSPNFLQLKPLSGQKGPAQTFCHLCVQLLPMDHQQAVHQMYYGDPPDTLPAAFSWSQMEPIEFSAFQTNTCNSGPQGQRKESRMMLHQGQ